MGGWWPSGQRVGMVIPTTRVRVPLQAGRKLRTCCFDYYNPYFSDIVQEEHWGGGQHGPGKCHLTWLPLKIKFACTTNGSLEFCVGSNPLLRDTEQVLDLGYQSSLYPGNHWVDE